MSEEVYPMNRSWNLYFDLPYFHKSYEDVVNPTKWFSNIKEVYCINNFKNFWGIYNNLISPSDLCIESSYYYFAKGFKPTEGDHLNVEKYKITLNISDEFIKNINKHSDKNYINIVWTNLLLKILGENNYYSEWVNGMNIIKQKMFYTIEVWTDIDNNSIENIHTAFVYICESLFSELFDLILFPTPEDLKNYLASIDINDFLNIHYKKNSHSKNISGEIIEGEITVSEILDILVT